MSAWRDTGDDCPIPAAQAKADHKIDFVLSPANMDLCGPCSYFRGASMPPTDRDENGRVADFRPVCGRWRMNCNFPRDGSHVWEAVVSPEQMTGEWTARPSWLGAAFSDE